MNHILNLDNQAAELHEIFKKLQSSNALLFLGAGASVTEKRYLSKEIIELYESYLGKNIQEKNITRFVDILSADSSFSRSHFDTFVASLLYKLEITEAHKILAGIPWREIITTNYDLLVERAFDVVGDSYNKVYDLKVIRNTKQFNYKEANAEVKYIKLHGCLQDKSQYPFAFSTDDFNNLKSFYRLVLHELKNISPEIMFISIGYSYADEFGKELLEKFDSYNYRDKRWIINVDPFPNEGALPFYSKNKICIIKSSFQDFFLRYQKWEAEHHELISRKKGLSISDSKNQFITIPAKLLLNLDGIVKQLNSQTKDTYIKDADFYKGEEPTFNIITRGVDVIKNKQILQNKQKIDEKLQGLKSTFIPIFFVTGEFGIGKSTFTMRMIYELEKDLERDLVAFEIIDFNRLKKEWIIELINISKAKNLVIFCDEIEIESYFKSLLDLQRDLSIEQFQDCCVFFIVPIRENILEKFRLNRNIPESAILQVTGKLEKTEIEDLLEKLKSTELITFRDANEKNILVRKIQKEYDSDSFIALMELITSGKHQTDLLSSYHQLSNETKRAFLYTALLHKHRLLMPAGWLKQNIDMDWDEFSERVIKAEGKGILLQEIHASHGTQPDLYFKTKHPLIASKLVDYFLPNKDRQFSFYDRMMKSVEPGNTSSYLVNNLLKSFIKNGEYSDIQMNKLFDSAYTKLSDDPYFLFNYAINLQFRNTKRHLQKALDLLIYAESLLENRNHRFIHRRAVINSELAKVSYESDRDQHMTSFYLDEATDLFITKRLMDPFSAYSYVDFIKTIIWDLEHFQYDKEDQAAKMIYVEELFDLANRTVTDGIERIYFLQNVYANYLKGVTDAKDYREYLLEMHSDLQLRPYACILLYNHYYIHQNYKECVRISDEMEYYQDNFEITKFLLKYYGRFLYNPNTRIKFLQLVKQNPHLEKDNPLRFNYFNFIAESYNHNFYDGKSFLRNIQNNINNLNPEYRSEWLDSEGNEVVFDAKVVKNSNERFKAIKIMSVQQTFRLMKGSYDAYTVGSNVKAKLHFYLYGIMAEIIES